MNKLENKTTIHFRNVHNGKEIQNATSTSWVPVEIFPIFRLGMVMY